METLFTSKSHAKQAKFIEELIYLKRNEIENKHYSNFYGTAEACRQRAKEVDEKLQRYIDRLEIAFPDVPFQRFLDY